MQLWDRLFTLFRIMHGYGLPAPVPPWPYRQDRQVQVRHYKLTERLPVLGALSRANDAGRPTGMLREPRRSGTAANLCVGTNYMIDSPCTSGNVRRQD
jgi:hypothetical protein